MRDIIIMTVLSTGVLFTWANLFIRSQDSESSNIILGLFTLATILQSVILFLFVIIREWQVHRKCRRMKLQENN